MKISNKPLATVLAGWLVMGAFALLLMSDTTTQVISRTYSNATLA